MQNSTMLTRILQIWYPSHFLQQDRTQGFRDVIRDTEVHMHMRLSRPTLQNFAIIGQKVINDLITVINKSLIKFDEKHQNQCQF